ncbi:MAG TPA: hypothetical protein VFV64_14215 [Permianibacter sp.]|nr:hypothetical protein [Permianibacter sp.]
MKKIGLQLLAMAGALMLLGGCAMKPSTESAMSKMMQPMTTVAEQAPDKARIIFLRPSAFGWLIDAPVFYLNGDEEQLLGISTYGTRIDHMVAPGKHLYMVIGESADFMEAEVEAGKTYYALVTPRMGVWKARFSLHPVHRESSFEFNLQHKEFSGWLNGAKPISLLPAGLDWQRKNQASIDEKRAEDYPEWLKKPEQEKRIVTLVPADGV